MCWFPNLPDRLACCLSDLQSVAVRKGNDGADRVDFPCATVCTENVGHRLVVGQSDSFAGNGASHHVQAFFGPSADHFGIVVLGFDECWDGHVVETGELELDVDAE